MKTSRKHLLGSAPAKKKLIYQKDLEDGNALANQPPEEELFYSLEEINQIRYLIALAPPPQFKVTTLILLTRAQIVSVFGVSPKTTIKYQMGISEKRREQHRGKMMVGEKIWLKA